MNIEGTAKMAKTVKVFVYGSLLRGEHNHRVLEGLKATFVAGSFTRRGWRLVDLGAFPAMVPGEGWVLGEVFEVSVEGLKELDRFEGVPALYQRQEIPLADGTQAFAYVMGPMQLAGRGRGHTLVAGGDWKKHREARDRTRVEARR